MSASAFLPGLPSPSRAAARRLCSAPAISPFSAKRRQAACFVGERRRRIIVVLDQKETDRSEVTLDELIRLFSVLSHDLKSPIFSIDGFSELLVGDYADKLDAEG